VLAGVSGFGTRIRPVLFERTVRQRRISWIQLNIPGSAASLATDQPH
jgi:hypothetical protein